MGRHSFEVPESNSILIFLPPLKVSAFTPLFTTSSVSYFPTRVLKLQIQSWKTPWRVSSSPSKFVSKLQVSCTTGLHECWDCTEDSVSFHSMWSKMIHSVSLNISLNTTQHVQFGTNFQVCAADSHTQSIQPWVTLQATLFIDFGAFLARLKGPMVVWKQVTNSNISGMSHITGSGGFSSSLAQSFLPKRDCLLVTLLDTSSQETSKLG